MAYLSNVNPPPLAFRDEQEVREATTTELAAATEMARYLVDEYGVPVWVARGDGRSLYLVTTDYPSALAEYLE